MPSNQDLLQSKLAVRAKPNQLQSIEVRLSINQHQIWFKMTIPELCPVARERVVMEPRRQRSVCCQQVHDFRKKIRELLRIAAFRFALEVTAKPSLYPYCPH